MRDTFHAIFYMARRDPLAILGFVLLVFFAVFFAHVQFKMKGIGVKTNPVFARPRDLGLPAGYLRVRAEHGWSPWPVYLMWPCVALGIVALVAGLFLLQN
jgi:hypothetical protein